MALTSLSVQVFSQTHVRHGTRTSMVSGSAGVVSDQSNGVIAGGGLVVVSAVESEPLNREASPSLSTSHSASLASSSLAASLSASLASSSPSASLASSSLTASLAASLAAASLVALLSASLAASLAASLSASLAASLSSSLWASLASSSPSASLASSSLELSDSAIDVLTVGPPAAAAELSMATIVGDIVRGLWRPLSTARF